MENIKATVQALYQVSSNEQKEKAAALFKQLDRMGDGKLVVGEVVEFLKKEENETVHPSILRKLGKGDHGSTLDFEEASVLYYLVHTKWPCCEGCAVFLEGIYFRCSECFDTSEATYNLCTTCFRKAGNETTCAKNHPARSFVDSHILLQSKSNALASKQANTGDIGSVLLPFLVMDDNVVKVTLNCCTIM